VLGALRVVPGERLSAPAKLALIAEILITYTRIRPRLLRQNFRQLALEVRSQPPARRTGLERGSLEARIVASRLGNAVYRTLRLLPTDSPCLTQALVLSSLLAARAIDGTVVIGAHSSPEFEAHAWVECQGRPLLPPLEFYESRLREL
jgi:hypothetical protein